MARRVKSLKKPAQGYGHREHKPRRTILGLNDKRKHPRTRYKNRIDDLRIRDLEAEAQELLT